MAKLTPQDLLRFYEELAPVSEPSGNHFVPFSRFLAELFEQFDLSEYDLTTAHSELLIVPKGCDWRDLPSAVLKLSPNAHGETVSMVVELIQEFGNVQVETMLSTNCKYESSLKEFANTKKQYDQVYANRGTARV